MTLRLRLVLGYAYLVMLVLVTAVSAIAGFVVLSRGIDRVLQDNVRSIEASMEMLESLERQDSATLSALLGGPGARVELAAADEAFRQALADARANITEDQEPEALGQLETAHEDLVATRDRIVASAPERPLSAYQEAIFPLFQTAKASVRELLDLNHAAMQRADRDARASAQRSGAWIGLLVVLAVVSLVVLSRALQRRVLERLAVVRNVSQALASGDTQRRVVLSGDDELSAIGERFNAILDRRQEEESRWRGRLSLEKRLTLSVFERLDPGGTIFSLDGIVLIGEPDDAVADAVRHWIREHGSDAVEELSDADEPTRSVDQEGREVRLELLLTGPSRPVAWWLRRTRPRDDGRAS